MRNIHSTRPLPLLSELAFPLTIRVVYLATGRGDVRAKLELRAENCDGRSRRSKIARHTAWRPTRAGIFGQFETNVRAETKIRSALVLTSPRSCKRMPGRKRLARRPEAGLRGEKSGVELNAISASN